MREKLLKPILLKIGNARLISSPRSRVAVLVLPTDEEQIIASEAVSLLHQEEAKT